MTSIETTYGILDEDETANLSGDESMTHLKATIDSSKKQEAPRKETDQKQKKTEGFKSVKQEDKREIKLRM